MALELAYETIAPTPTLSGVVIGIGSCDPNMLETQRSIQPYPIRFIRHPAIEIIIIVYCFRLKSTLELLRNTPRDWGLQIVANGCGGVANRVQKNRIFASMNLIKSRTYGLIMRLRKQRSRVRSPRRPPCKIFRGLRTPLRHSISNHCLWRRLLPLAG